MRMSVTTIFSISILFGSATLMLKAQTGEQAVAADAFVDSVGINIHLSYTRTLYYQNFPLIQRSLLALGVRHVRDGLADMGPTSYYYDRHNALGSAGIHGDFITNPSQTAPLLQSWPSRVTKSFESYEGPNEQDAKPNGIDSLRTFMPLLYQAARSGVVPAAPVIGPSLTKGASYPALGDISAYETFGNLHNYFSNRNPGTGGWGPNGYGSLKTNLRNLQLTSKAQPTYTTETGYTNDPKIPNYISPEIAAVYMPRLLLEQYLAGIQRTYIYELLSTNGEDFGLLDITGNQKPAFRAVANLLSLLTDKGAAYQPATLSYKITGGEKAPIHHLLFAKRDGTFYLALWIEAPSFDPNLHQPLAVPPQQVTLTLPSIPSMLKLHSWDETGTSVITSPARAATVGLSVSDRLMIVELKQR